jgi:endogenous inhibitor of DNA gyrase (YacG/DUF329 family)
MADAPPRRATADALCAEPCPICGRPAVAATRPFCSTRCANVDLNRWLTGVYAIPGSESQDEDGRPPEESGKA